MKRILASQFVRFAIVGAAGFLMDAGALYAALFFGAGLYSGRVVSYLMAATFTWALNRQFTFHGSKSSNKLAEWGRFLLANALGGGLNYLVYAALVSNWNTAATHPIVAVAAGSFAGLACNFILSRTLVFKVRDAQS
jgi:putative flippase GtrA